MVIRSAIKHDLKTCEKLMKVPELAEADGDFMDVKFIQNYLNSDYFLVAEDNGKILGFAIGEEVRGKVAMLWYLTVKKGERGKGIGRKILGEFERRARRHHVKWVNLFAPANNKKTLAFYKNLRYYKGSKHYEIEKVL